MLFTMANVAASQTTKRFKLMRSTQSAAADGGTDVVVVQVLLVGCGGCRAGGHSSSIQMAIGKLLSFRHSHAFLSCLRALKHNANERVYKEL